MAKPILVIRVPISQLDIESMKDVDNKISSKLQNEYHVLVVNMPEGDTFSIECFNDCKGLPDVDIEELIKSIK